MGDPIGYVVITYPQTGGSPDLGWTLYDRLDDAQEDRDDQQAQTNAVGRKERHVVAEVTPIDEEDPR